MKKQDLLTLPDEEEDIAPPPPSTRGRIYDDPEPPSAAVVALGPPPPDSLAAAKWAYQVHMQLASEALLDPRLTPSQRRSEVRSILTSAKGHMTDAARYDVKRLIEEDRRQLEAKKRGRAAAVKRSGRPPAPEGAKIIPITRMPDEGEV